MSGPRIFRDKKTGMTFADRLYTEEEFQAIMQNRKLVMIQGELLLLVDGIVQDSSIYYTPAQRDRAMGEFVAIKTRIEHEKPYAKVTIDERTK